MSNADTTKILYCITKSNFGGAQRYIYDLATNLRKSYQPNSDVVIAHGGNGRLAGKLRKVGINTHYLPSAQRDFNVLKEITLASELMGCFFAHRPNIIHLNSSKMGALGTFIGRMYWLYSLVASLFTSYPVPTIIFTAHGWAFEETRFSLIKRRIMLLFQAITVILSTKTIAVSKHTKHVITQKCGFLENSITVIHNGVENFDRSPKQQARETIQANVSTPINANRQLIGTIAELHHNKGLDTLIDAGRELKDTSKKDFHILIIGSGEEQERLQSLADENDALDIVHFAGYTEHARTLLHAFDVFVLPSRKEGFPYAILEAGIAARPTIASAIGGIPEIITDQENGLLVPPNEVGQLSKAMHTLLKQERKRKDLGQQLRETVTNNFTKAEMVKKTKSVYNKNGVNKSPK